jgi:hypothetical protein
MGSGGDSGGKGGDDGGGHKKVSTSDLEKMTADLGDENWAAITLGGIREIFLWIILGIALLIFGIYILSGTQMGFMMWCQVMFYEIIFPWFAIIDGWLVVLDGWLTVFERWTFLHIKQIYDRLTTDAERVLEIFYTLRNDIERVVSYFDKELADEIHNYTPQVIGWIEDYIDFVRKWTIDLFNEFNKTYIIPIENALNGVQEAIGVVAKLGKDINKLVFPTIQKGGLLWNNPQLQTLRAGLLHTGTAFATTTVATGKTEEEIGAMAPDETEILEGANKAFLDEVDPWVDDLYAKFDMITDDFLDTGLIPTLKQLEFDPKEWEVTFQGRLGTEIKTDVPWKDFLLRMLQDYADVFEFFTKDGMDHCKDWWVKFRARFPELADVMLLPDEILHPELSPESGEIIGGE